MPAIDEEIEGADLEGVKIDYLAAPIEIHTENGRAVGMKCQRMELGEPDSSGRRRPVPIEGDTFDMDFTCLIAAVSQAPDFAGFDSLIEGKDWIKVDEKFKTKLEGVYSGGDNINLGLAIDAIANGNAAAVAIHEMIAGVEDARAAKLKLGVVRAERMQLGYYKEAPRVARREAPVDERLKSMAAEIVRTFTTEEAVNEAQRCMSCGKCFDCATCWSFCQDNAIVRPLTRGEPYKVKLDFCTGCKKCSEVCPCGYIEMQ
jgi:NADPH-dependent glutamate synthase beta subunit-like oxidoreductase